MNKEDDKSPMLPIIAYTGLALVVIGTILGFFNIGFTAGMIAGLLIALYICWIVITFLMCYIKPNWSTATQAIVAFIIAIVFIWTLYEIGLHNK